MTQVGQSRHARLVRIAGSDAWLRHGLQSRNRLERWGYAVGKSKSLCPRAANCPTVTVIPGVVFAGVMDGAGPTVAGGVVYVHSRYAGRQTANPNDLSGRDGNVLIAFSVDGK